VRREWPRYVGWSTWDYYGSRFTYDQIVGNMKELVALNAGANLLQVDGGWWAQKGDYLTTRADIPGGMKGLAREIRAAGLIPGLHLDGMRADLPSQLAQRHPEYFLRTAAGELVRSRASASDTERRRLFFDYSHPGYGLLD
jgi:alpha-galactosidase